MRRVELHCHSVYSDGTLSPAELAQRAAQAGVELLILTDHDTLSGGEELFAAGRSLGLDTRLGLEVNCAGAERVHILGYGVNPRADGFLSRLGAFRERRTVRARRIVDNLRALGLPISYEDVRGAARETLGRPHVADALRRLGAVKSRQEAFERFLIKGKPGYVEPMGPSPAEAISLIRDAQGIACLAHPQTAGGEAELEELLKLGLQGIEVYYGAHTPSQIRAYAAWAESRKLLAVGGSDFHGPQTGRSGRMGVDYEERTLGAFLERLAQCS